MIAVYIYHGSFALLEQSLKINILKAFLYRTLISAGENAQIAVISTTEIITDIMLRFAESSANWGNDLIAVIGAKDVIGANTIAIRISFTIGEYGNKNAIKRALTKAAEYLIKIIFMILDIWFNDILKFRAMPITNIQMNVFRL